MIAKQAINVIRERTGVSVTMVQLRKAIGKPKLRQGDDLGEMTLQDVVSALVVVAEVSYLKAFSDELAASPPVVLPSAPPPEPPAPIPPTGESGPAEAPSTELSAAQPPPPAAEPPSGETAPAAEGQAAQAPEPPRPKTQQSVEATDNDIAIAKALDTIQSRLRDVPPEAFVEREVEGLGKLRLYRPKVRLSRDKRGNPVYVYDSLDPRDRLIAVTDADYEKYGATGEWAGRHMPMITDTRFRELTTLFLGYSTHTNVCAVGGENFSTLLKSKIRSWLIKRWRAPYSELPGDQLRFARMCYRHWMLEQVRPAVRQAWMQATVDLQGLQGEAFQTARVNRMVELIDEIFQKENVRNPRITRAGVARAFAAYAESLTETKETANNA